MTHQTQDFSCHAGDDLEIPVTVTDDGTATGTPVDITGATPITFAIVPNVGTTRVLTKGLGSGIVLNDPSNGQYTVTLSKTDTALMGAGEYRYITRITDGSGNKSTIAEGVITVHPTFLTASE